MDALPLSFIALDTTLTEVIRSLYGWAKANDFAGHDPHDLLNAPALGRVESPLARLIAVQLGRRSFIDFRSFLRVPRTENPKALALFLSGLLRARGAATPDWRAEAVHLGKRLIALQQENGGWGYPFPWQSRTHFLPCGTPNIVTTSFAGNALIELYRKFPSVEVKEAVLDAANYIDLFVPRVLAVPGRGTAERTRHVVQSNAASNGIAFGYAEDDPQIVFNASLLGAEFLLNAGKLLGIQEYVDLAAQAAKFVASRQRPDGSWHYGLEPSQTWIDSFHTGFVIVSMKRIAEMLDGEGRAGSTDPSTSSGQALRDAALRGFDYYRRTFIEPDFAVKYFDSKRYPIDAHAIGQALVTLATFGDVDTGKRVAEWAIRNMRSSKGYFFYQRHRLFTNRIAYMRWSNAWMFRGLAEIMNDEL